ncbi:CobW family GTP-binding protein [Rhodospirillum rubrum]|uniref:Cobalamin synthesis protein/P47K n=1 Tax=Rhodospirillum rubrum (strain ATCC 11170 / ATH 1.1.1 / DSM 467 / LMG 4362 / NCIMB 8255 / S1) TaxID=269796 RepID=Q2RTY4_RHORT|nr:GTP-binding protein [Rhodospirillum rubrum]ABC22411.1 Cobalamin synthesis protein/P47K [Rhodospirillum rubrum ATCC 11170]AEO48128.1 cobalamin synthesis protein/P47K [Rhodospirillum rubrum F11]MBK5953992.1 GTP-binding protein [Rhodospirillum rubrum]QXG82047.1 GTP-binding protein [Rhodospirillum rubrum]HAP99908.1 GTP-binding protein [Rhodospirillum rubrum]
MMTIPVTILTGFLGSGKSTLLNRLLRHPAMGETAVVINEFGEVGLDHLLVRQVDEDIVLLNAGCLCCTVRGDMVTALHDLFLKRVRGDVPEFQRLAIETTGLADPAPIIHTLMTDPLIGGRFRLDGVVTVIDAVNGEKELDEHIEAVKQAAVADRLVLSKTDLVEDSAALKARLKALNPAAIVLEAIEGDIHPDALLDCGLFSSSGKAPDVAQWLRDEAYRDRDEQHHGHGHHHDHDHHDHDHGHDHHHDHHPHDVNRHDARISSFCLTFDEPLDWELFVSALEMLISSKGEDLLRIKGILDVIGQDRPIAVHGVQHVFHPPVPLPAWPAGEPKTSKLVFITRDLDRATVEGLLRAALGGQEVLLD